MKVRSCLTAGVAAVAVSAVVAAPTAVAAPQHRAPTVAAPVALSAAVKPLVLKPVDVRQIATARDVITRLDPDSALAAAPAPQNVASDWITSGYEFIKYWVSYGVDLAQYVLQFIPFGGLIGAQIGIVYDSLVVPIADSVVYDLINPVVNNPLNLSVWVNGFVDVGVTSVNALINTGIAELNYFFGWLIPPLPFAAEATEATALKLPAEEPERTLLGAELTKHVDGVLADLQTAVKAKADAWVDALVPEVVKPDVQTAPEPAVALVDEVPRRQGRRPRVRRGEQGREQQERRLGGRAQVPPQHERRRHRPDRHEVQRREGQHACASEHDVAARAAERQADRRHQERDER